MVMCIYSLLFREYNNDIQGRGNDMFTYEEIQSLNSLEIEVYNYVLVNMKAIPEMKIRELADQVHVSTTTVLRFCNKMGCEGYAEFKWKLKDYMLEHRHQPQQEDFTLLNNFIKHIQDPEYDAMLEKVAHYIVDSDHITFFGIGSSGILARYGAHYISDFGVFAHYIDDPYYPVPIHREGKALCIVLSVSGESRPVLEQVRLRKEQQEVIITITNSENCLVAQMADVALTYYMPLIKLQREYNVTTQVPLVLILESIGHKVQRILYEQEQV